MGVIGFGHVNLRAPLALMEALKAFYCDVVGLKQGWRPDLSSHGYWLYAGDQCVLHLSLSRPDEAHTPGARTTFDHTAFTCTRRAEMEARLRRHGIAFRTAGVPALGITQLFLADPAGNGVELSFLEDGPAAS